MDGHTRRLPAAKSWLRCCKRRVRACRVCVRGVRVSSPLGGLAECNRLPSLELNLFPVQRKIDNTWGGTDGPLLVLGTPCPLPQGTLARRGREAKGDARGWSRGGAGHWIITSCTWVLRLRRRFGLGQCQYDFDHRLGAGPSSPSRVSPPPSSYLP